MNNHNGTEQNMSLGERLMNGMSEGLVVIAMSMGLRTGLLRVLLSHNEPISTEQLAEEAGCKPRLVFLNLL